MEAYLATAELALAKRDYALAAEAYGQAARLVPDDPAVHCGLAKAFAEVYRRLGDPIAERRTLEALASRDARAGGGLSAVDGVVRGG